MLRALILGGKEGSTAPDTVQPQICLLLMSHSREEQLILKTGNAAHESKIEHYKLLHVVDLSLSAQMRRSGCLFKEFFFSQVIQA